MYSLNFYAIIFMAAIGTNDFETKLALGPFSTFEDCITVSAEGIGGELKTKYPEWEFRVACIDRAPDASKGEQLKIYNLTELYELVAKLVK